MSHPMPVMPVSVALKGAPGLRPVTPEVIVEDTFPGHATHRRQLITHTLKINESEEGGVSYVFSNQTSSDESLGFESPIIQRPKADMTNGSTGGITVDIASTLGGLQAN